MGFPAPYSELLLPKLILHFLSFLAILRRLLSSAFCALGLGDLLLDPSFHSDILSSPATLIGQNLPSALSFGQLLSQDAEGRLPDCCSVCLCDFQISEEVRRLCHCRHVFHSRCLDTWLLHGCPTCPLCRATLLHFPSHPSFLLSDHLFFDSSYHS